MPALSQGRLEPGIGSSALQRWVPASVRLAVTAPLRRRERCAPHRVDRAKEPKISEEEANASA